MQSTCFMSSNMTPHISWDSLWGNLSSDMLEHGISFVVEAAKNNMYKVNHMDTFLEYVRTSKEVTVPVMSGEYQYSRLIPNLSLQDNLVLLAEKDVSRILLIDKVLVDYLDTVFDSDMPENITFVRNLALYFIMYHLDSVGIFGKDVDTFYKLSGRNVMNMLSSIQAVHHGICPKKWVEDMFIHNKLPDNYHDIVERVHGMRLYH